ncbi:MAG: HlyD family efflux transporter periplasmic adaptor subunit [Lachnospiraceae bacterium]|nr:HlyD family efflux transporter periplasmic adaptor subunit [Lachnospiraceae bacterium]
MKKNLIIKLVVLCLAGVLITGGVVYAVNLGKSYTACEAAVSEISGTIKETGKIHGARDKVYYASVTASVDTVSVKEGDRVKKGDIIVKYDAGDLKRMLTEAEIRSEQAELDYSGRVKESDSYASKYRKAKDDDEAYAILYWLYREKGDEISEDEFARNYYLQCQIDSVNKEIAEKEREIAEGTHEKNEAMDYGMPGEEGYSEDEVDDIKDAQEELDRLNEELAELKKGLYITSAGAATPEENQALNDVGNVMEDITRNWAEAKNNKATYENMILNEDEKEALLKNTELSREEKERIFTDLQKAESGIRADFSGVITELGIYDGGFAEEGTELFTLETTEELVCRTDISRYDIPGVHIGQRAVTEIGGKQYEGEVTKINSLATADSSDKSRIEVEVSLPGADEAAIIGMEADVTIYTEVADNVLVIPVEAFYSDDGGDYCYTVENARISKKYVSAGINNGDEVEIKEGLKKGDIVITDAVTDEAAGTKARYVIN